MGETHIEWTDKTWNPSTGCNAVSEGCRNCYAEQWALKRGPAMEQGRIDKLRLEERQAIANPFVKTADAERVSIALQKAEADAVYSRHGFRFTEHADRLLEPLHWRKPARVFTCSMSDLFHELATEQHLDRVWAVMAACPHLTFQVLTKRPQRMADYLAGLATEQGWRRRQTAVQWLLFGHPELDAACARSKRADEPSLIERLTLGFGDADGQRIGQPVVLPNVWLGTSVESMEVLRPGWYPGKPEVPGRIDSLLACPAAVRFLSCEPLLGPVDLCGWLVRNGHDLHCANCGQLHSGGTGWTSSPGRPRLQHVHPTVTPPKPENCPHGGPEGMCQQCRDRKACAQFRRGPSAGIHWVIAGGESGPGARPMHPQWARDLRDQCSAAGVAFFFKQFGAWLDFEGHQKDAPQKAGVFALTADGKCAGGGDFSGGSLNEEQYRAGNGAWMVRCSGHNGEPAKWPAHLADLNVRQFPEVR